jgi:hypothetical protein
VRPWWTAGARAWRRALPAWPQRCPAAPSAPVGSWCTHTHTH